MNKFHETLGMIFSLGKNISDDKKKSKLSRTLPESFAPLAMVSSKMKHDEFMNATQTEIARRKMIRDNSGSGVKAPKANTAGRSRVNEERINKKKRN